MKKAVLLLSGGLDSAANLVLSDEFSVVLALTIDYGQRGASRELASASALASHFRIEHKILNFRGFSALIDSRSALLSDGELPEPESPRALDDFESAQKSAAAVWVPNRNGVMLSIAAAVAESRGYEAVAVGFNLEEATTFADNSSAFMKATDSALQFSTANKVKVLSATVGLDKKQIVRALSERGDFPFKLLWSCYRAEAVHCGACESCQRLKRAVREGVVLTDVKQKILSEVFGAHHAAL